MRSDPPVRQLDQPRLPVPARTSHQVRRFAVLWALATAGVLAAIVGTSVAAGSYRSDASDRATAADSAQAAATALLGSIQQEMNHRLAWELSHDTADANALSADQPETRRGIAGFTQAVRSAAAAGVPVQDAPGLAAALRRWEVSTASADRPTAPPAAGIDRRGAALATRLATTANRLTAAAMRADSDARSATRFSQLAMLVATLIGMAVLLAGGGLLLQKAWRLAVEYDSRRERDARWAEQIEQILAWSSRAKEATTRSQLIGFAHMAPRDALGAACLGVAEGGPPRHTSHGLARITLPVDSAGEGLHASVCFAPGRGDELDHHALDLMLGHLAALWRTVLRQEELERAAGHDALTGLPNRRTFESDLRRRVAMSKRRDLGFTLAMVDLDHFKDVNDSFGHPEGDAVLRRAGEAIRQVLRGSDRIYRLGGEEFAVLLETTDPAGVADLLDRARQAVRSLAIEPSQGRSLSASIGWAVFPVDADDRAELVRTADAALYRAKTSGRDRVIGSKAA
ncbi:MAG TPA: GGDEF domain-containing protein [Gaiellales bacterium]|nr:GGDEF domain-containing protein [Gaiellales bacterium]